MEPVSMLVSDVDFTLTGDAAALARFEKWAASERGNVRIVYNSGRFFHSVWQSVRETSLPVPDAVIGGVGTEIGFPPDGRRLPNWPHGIGHWNGDFVRTLVREYGELEMQPAEFQSPHKISLFGESLEQRFLDCLRSRLGELGVEAEIVYSSNLHLDILPAGVNKGHAIRPLIEHWNIAPEGVIVAGDSGNDLAMFRHGYRGIVVGNAQPELRSITDPSVYQAASRHAAGVLEGIEFWMSPNAAGATSLGIPTNSPSNPERDAIRGRHE